MECLPRADGFPSENIPSGYPHWFAIFTYCLIRADNTSLTGSGRQTLLHFCSLQKSYVPGLLKGCLNTNQKSCILTCNNVTNI